MKFIPTLFSKNTRRFIALFAMTGAVISLSSCTKNEFQPQPEVSGLMVFNASPVQNSIDFLFAGQKVNTSPLLFGQKIDYVKAYSGVRNVSIVNTTNSQTIKSSDITLKNGLYHSLFVLTSGDSTSFYNVVDSVAYGSSDKGRVRFINLAADAPAYKIEIEGDTATFAPRAYKALTPFKAVTAKTTAKIFLKAPATNEIVATLENVELKRDGFYTIWVKGLVNATVDAQKISLQVSKHEFLRY